MLEQAVIEDMVDYILKLEKEFYKRGVHPGLQANVFSLFVFHQFNATRNDTKIAFDRLIAALEKKEGQK
jgi:hypothetical protein